MCLDHNPVWCNINYLRCLFHFAFFWFGKREEQCCQKGGKGTTNIIGYFISFLSALYIQVSILSIHLFSFNPTHPIIKLQASIQKIQYLPMCSVPGRLTILHFINKRYANNHVYLVYMPVLDSMFESLCLIVCIWLLFLIHVQTVAHLSFSKSQLNHLHWLAQQVGFLMY